MTFHGLRRIITGGNYKKKIWRGLINTKQRSKIAATGAVSGVSRPTRRGAWAFKLIAAAHSTSFNHTLHIPISSRQASLLVGLHRSQSCIPKSSWQKIPRSKSVPEPMDAMEYNTYHDSGGYLQHLVKCCNACANLCLNSFHLATGCHGTHCCHSLETLIDLKVVRCKEALTRGSRVAYGAEDVAYLRHLETLPHATQHLLHCTFDLCGPPDCFTIFIIHIGSCVYIYIYYYYAQRLGFAPAFQRRGFPFPIKYCCWEDQQRY